MNVIQIGPFTLDGLIFLCVVAFAAAMFAAMRYDKKHGGQVEKIVWWLTVGAALVGRLVFVLRFWSAYSAQPMEIINIRDGGFDWRAALVVYGLALVVFWFRRRSLFKGLIGSLGVAALVIGGGLLWLSPQKKDIPNWYQMAHLEHLQPLLGMASDTAQIAQDGKGAMMHYQGKPTVINLWATWCPPCRREMPVLEQAQKKHQDVNFVFINQGEQAEQILAFLEEQGLDLSNLWLDSNGLSGQAIHSKGLPSTIFIDSSGQIKNTRLGELSAASLEFYLESIQPQK